MRAIKVTYRAAFEQPTGVLNPMGVRLPGWFPVEIFASAGKWKARELQSPRRQIYTKLGSFPTHLTAMSGVEAAFEQRREPWQLWGTVPGDGTSTLAVERLLLPEEVCDLGNGKMGFRTAEDYTHILHAPNIPPGAHMPPAACGAQVKADCFINNRANVEPSCKPCAEIWRREYRNR